MSDSAQAKSDEPLDPATQRRVVRDRYARIATETEAKERGCSTSDGCCTEDASGTGDTAETATQLGYSTADVESIDGEANLGLGCGNPQALASLTEGETVVDLGSGAGFDCFLTAQEVGEAGQVIGVDMTPEMVEKARANATKNESENVEFRLGEIEHLPVADDSIDVIISNCVVNLSPNKPQVFREAFRILRPGGRLAISDVVMTADVSRDIRADPDSVASCVAGASTIDRLNEMLTDAGFEQIDISPKDDSDQFIREWDDEYDVSEFLVSASITGRKPE
ncbi:arsenite methyltransferase [Natrinema halophilum]|uniref:Arsenite methyltransferase n=1 Tax=Natrinema halophilum TaxID=1699371 RepID=A0A7D5K8W3_9EURY|nr:arsenite methyltransferase [Natrinema halophilum]QLG51063.1 arsenite methyltransferase [Natrinema halophilum]